MAVDTHSKLPTIMCIVRFVQNLQLSFRFAISTGAAWKLITLTTTIWQCSQELDGNIDIRSVTHTTNSWTPLPTYKKKHENIINVGHWCSPGFGFIQDVPKFRAQIYFSFGHCKSRRRIPHQTRIWFVDEGVWIVGLPIVMGRLGE